MDEQESKDESYIEYLCSLGLNGLSDESKRLNNARNNLNETGQELSSNYYPSFIATNECMKNLSSDLLEVQEDSDYLVRNIPKFCDLIANFADESRAITKQWKEASRMLSKHSTLLEFLEIPQMMETSLRTGNYDEVLRLDSYVKKLRMKYGPGISFLEDVMQETNKVRDSMAAQLTKELKCAIQLPTCIKAVGHLRQLGKYSDLELRIKFLTVRDLYLQSIVKDIPITPPLFHLTRTIELFRINLFDIATQFRAVFSSEDPFLNPNQHSKESNVLSSWICTKIEQFFNILESDLISCIDNEPYFPYDSVIDPCYYFGLSMARIGFEIKPRLNSIFQRMCMKRFRFSLDKAEKTFQESLNGYSMKDEANLTSLLKSTAEKDGKNSPLTLIACLPPLKWLLNGILMALNDIRLVSSLNMGFCVTDVLNKSLIRSSEILLSYCRKQNQQTAAAGNAVNEGLRELCTRFISILLPHVKSCLDKLFPPQSLAKSMGLSFLEFKKLLENRNEVFIQRIELDSINVSLQEYVKINQIEEIEYNFMEPESGMVALKREEGENGSKYSIESSTGNDDGPEKKSNTLKMRSDSEGDEKKKGIKLTTSTEEMGENDDKTSQEEIQNYDS